MTDPADSPQPATPPLPTPPVLSVRAALRWSWSTLRPAIGPAAGAAALWLFVYAGVYLVVWDVSDLLAYATVKLTGGDLTDYYSAFDDGSMSVAAYNFVLGVLMSLTVGLSTSCGLNGLLKAAGGERPGLGDFFTPRALRAVMAISLTVGIAESLAGLLFADYLGREWLMWTAWAIIAVLAMWSCYFAVDLDLPAGQALHSGLALALNRPGVALVAFVVSLLVLAVGAALLAVGLVVAVPLSGLVLLAYFRALTAPSETT